MKMFAMVVVAVTVLCCCLSSPVQAQSDQHVIQTLSEAKWGPAPPLLPKGAEIAVLAGNPMGNGRYTVRLKFPANYVIPAHSHPTDENVVVVSGKVTFGMGDKMSKTASGNKALAVGGYALMPAGVNHYAYAGPAGATIVLYGEGPVQFKYVNPADDPRNAK